MNLDTPTKILQIVLGEAKTTNDCPITTSYFDSVPGGFNLLNHNVLSNGVTVVTAVAAPGPNVERQVKEVRLVNTDTVSHLVTLQLFDGTNTWIIQSQTIAVNGLFLYTPEGGTATVPTGGGGGGSSLTVEDGSTTVVSVTTLKFTSGATVTNAGGGEADVAISGGSPAVLSTGKITVSSAQILALSVTDVPLIAAPGAGKYILVLNVSYDLIFNTTPYTGGFNTGLYYGSGALGLAADQEADNVVTATQSFVGYGPPASGSTNIQAARTFFENLGIVLATGAPFLAGDGTLGVTILYAVVDL